MAAPKPPQSWLIKADSVVFDVDASGALIELGKGGFATVYAGTLRGRAVALKKFNVASLSLRARAQFEAEVESMWKHQHPSILSVLGAVMEKGNFIIVLEKMESNLYSWLRNHDLQHLSIMQRVQWLWEIALGVKFLHERRVGHRDLKSPNCLLDASNHVRVSDFGLAVCRTESESTHVNPTGNITGTIRWMAPELFQVKDKISHFAADVWAFACVGMEILTGEVPFHKLQTSVLQSLLVNNPAALRDAIPAFPPSTPAALSDLLRRCLEIQPKSRPKMEAIEAELKALFLSLGSGSYESLADRAAGKKRVKQPAKYPAALPPNEEKEEESTDSFEEVGAEDLSSRDDYRRRLEAEAEEVRRVIEAERQERLSAERRAAQQAEVEAERQRVLNEDRRLTRQREAIAAEQARVAEERRKVEAMMRDFEALQMKTQQAAAAAQLSQRHQPPPSYLHSARPIPLFERNPAPLLQQPRPSSVQPTVDGRGGTFSGSYYRSTGSANGREIFTGPKGGSYYINASGNKTYVKGSK